jgi:DNA-binding winged helix-turn-helix (wHTH) protein
MIKQLVDNGSNVTLSLSEDIELEPISQQQMILEAVDRTVTDDEVKQQIKPLLEAILKSQPQTVIKTYPKTVIQITMPKRKYQIMGNPQVGEILQVDIKR